MMRMMQSNPAMMQQAMAQMNNMRPEDWAQANELMGRMSGDDLAKQTAQMSQQMNAQQKCRYQPRLPVSRRALAVHAAGKHAAPCAPHGLMTSD